VVGKFGYRITLDEETYRNFKELKRIMGAETWNELSYKLLELALEVAKREKRA